MSYIFGDIFFILFMFLFLLGGVGDDGKADWVCAFLKSPPCLVFVSVFELRDEERREQTAPNLAAKSESHRASRPAWPLLFLM